MLIASFTERPRIRSMTSRILRGEELIYRFMARASSIGLACLGCGFGGSGFAPQPGVAAEDPGRGELTELMPYHPLVDIHRDEFVSVVHGERVPDKVWRDRGGSRPGLDHLFLARLRHGFDFRQQPLVDKGALFERSAHPKIPGLFTSLDDVLIRFQLMVPGFLSLGMPAPGGYRVGISLRGFPFTPAVGVIDRVLNDAA